jgi:hypothetical protein
VIIFISLFQDLILNDFENCMNYIENQIEIRVQSVFIDLDYIEQALIEQIDSFESQSLKRKVLFQNKIFEFTTERLGKFNPSIPDKAKTHVEFISTILISLN